MPKASQYTPKDLVMLGFTKIGDVVSTFFNVWNASSHF
jgi:hypothetical protein